MRAVVAVVAVISYFFPFLYKHLSYNSKMRAREKRVLKKFRKKYEITATTATMALSRRCPASVSGPPAVAPHQFGFPPTLIIERVAILEQLF